MLLHLFTLCESELSVRRGDGVNVDVDGSEYHLFFRCILCRIQEDSLLSSNLYGSCISNSGVNISHSQNYGLYWVIHLVGLFSLHKNTAHNILSASILFTSLPRSSPLLPSHVQHTTYGIHPRGQIVTWWTVQMTFGRCSRYWLPKSLMVLQRVHI